MRGGKDFNETFAPVAKPTTLRAMLAIATKHQCLLFAGDVETAFLASGDGLRSVGAHATILGCRRRGYHWFCTTTLHSSPLEGRARNTPGQPVVLRDFLCRN